MNLLREVAGELTKMFVGDAWSTAGILAVVSVTAWLKGHGVVPPLVGGAILLLGCLVVLVASVVLSARRHRAR
ncbi:MAG TPA: hypothetical protein VNW98_04735 [Burkholderiaceae bacterium]|jgi:hypothetical protein|nr:hypothetical protein [Burkholderiaceae bacterium]